eukprot:scaffold79643_cov26-Tisochrysis_lutea.AAC.1
MHPAPNKAPLASLIHCIGTDLLRKGPPPRCVLVCADAGVCKYVHPGAFGCKKKREAKTKTSVPSINEQDESS